MSNAPEAPPASVNPAPRPPPRWQTSFRRTSFDADWDFVRRVLIVILLVALAYFLWSIGRVLLLVFAAILLAVLLRALADIIAQRTPVKKSWSLWLSVAILAVVLIGFLALFGAQIVGQGRQIVEQLPAAIDSIGTRFGMPNATAKVEEAVRSNLGGNVLSSVAGIGFTVIGGLADLLLVLVAGIYLAADPTIYRVGAAKLLPETQHERVYGALDATAIALRLWSYGQLISMTIVGVLSGLAFSAIGLPSPLALGIIAAFTDFIPVIGPILGAVPALIFASTVDSQTVLWTLVAVIVIQQLEGNVIMPLVQKRAVSMPPALALFAIVAFGLLFGFLGVFLAVPLTVALMVLVKKLWVRETLGEATSLPGEGQPDQPASPREAISRP